MDNWKLTRLTPLLGKSEVSDKLGQTPLLPKWNKSYLNTETGEITHTTDLKGKEYKRDSIFNDFLKTYSSLYRQHKISILTIVVNEESYLTISKFMNTISRKLKRKGISKLGYVWSRDIGEKRFVKHYHLLLYTFL